MEFISLLRPDIILFAILVAVSFGYGHIKGKNALISLSLASLLAFLIYLLLPEAWVMSLITGDASQAFYARTAIFAVITGVLHFWVLRKFVIGDGWGVGKLLKLALVSLAWALFVLIVLHGLGLEALVGVGAPFTLIIATGFDKILATLILIGVIAVGK